jgi:SnoaL-like domain
MPNDHGPGTDATTAPASGRAGRRAMLRAGAAIGATAALGAAQALRADSASAAGRHGSRLPYPDVADTSHATERAARIIKAFFAAKSLHQAAAMVSFFAPAPAPVLYIDAGLGLTWPSQASLLQVWSSPPFSTAPADALSYPIRVAGDERSATIEFVDTPKLLGQEFRFLSSLTFDRRGKIVRWIDYWDGRGSLTHLPIGTLGPYPTDFRDGQGSAAKAVKTAATRLQAAFGANDPATAAGLFTPDAVYEDMALHTRVEGQPQIQRYLTRGLATLPYGAGAAVANVTGSGRGGGYEWRAAPSAAPLARGHTVLELDNAGKVSRFTVIYDAFQFPDAAYQSLGLLALEL